MTNYLKIDHEKKLLIKDRTFEKNASIVGSAEYQMLEQARKDYPDYDVIRRKIKKSKNKKETYAGLTYKYIEEYIESHENAENYKTVLAEYEELKLISKCHQKGKRYPTIKKWFLEKYPAVKNYGIENAA